MCQLIFIWHYPEFIKSIMTCFLCPGEPTSKLGGICQACGRLHWGRHIHLCWHSRLQVGENSHPTTNSNLRTYLSFNHCLTEDPKECGPWRRRDWSQAWMYHGMMWENIDFILCQYVLVKLWRKKAFFNINNFAHAGKTNAHSHGSCKACSERKGAVAKKIFLTVS